jgi:hypothetical protein
MEKPKCENHDTHEYRLDSGLARIKTLEERDRQSQELLIRLVAIQETFNSSLNDKEDRLRALELCPAKKWDSVGLIVITSVIGAIVGFLAKSFL